MYSNAELRNRHKRQETNKEISHNCLVFQSKEVIALWTSDEQMGCDCFRE